MREAKFAFRISIAHCAPELSGRSWRCRHLLNIILKYWRRAILSDFSTGREAVNSV